MATITAAAGGGNWSAGGTWVGGVAPTAADDAVLANTSGAVTIDGTSGSPNLCRSLNCTGYTSTLTAGATAFLQIGDGTAGQFTLVAGMTFTPNVAATFKFVSTTTGNNITFGGKLLGAIIFDGVGGAWQFQDNLTFAAGGASAITLTNGSLDTNSKTISSSNGGSFISSNSNTRTLTLGTTNWTISSNGNWNVAISTGMTLSAASSTVTIGNSTVTFDGGGLTYGTLSCTSVSTSTITINGNNTFGTLTTSGGAGLTGSYLLGGNQTVTGTFTSNGNSVINRIYIRSTVRGTSRTITAATVTVTNIDLQDITGAGAGSWNLSAITGLSGDCGGNSGITFTTPANQFWVPSAGTSTGSMSAVTRWATTSGGTAGTGRSPLPQDTSMFDSGSIDAAARTVTLDKPRIGPVNWTGVTNTPAWAKSTACSFFGTITMVSGMTNSGTANMTAEGRSAPTINSGTLTWTNPLIIDCGPSSLTLAANFSSSSTLTGTTGTFASASTYTMTFTTITWGGGTITGTGTISTTGAMSFTGGTATSTGNFTPTTTFSVSGGTVGSGVELVTGGTTISFSGGTTNLKGFSGTSVSHSTGTVTIGSSGFTATSFTKNGSGGMTINGASTFSGVLAFSSTGTLQINANVTGSSTMTQTGQTISGNNATLAYSGGSFVWGVSGTSGMLYVPNMEGT